MSKMEQFLRIANARLRKVYKTNDKEKRGLLICGAGILIERI